MHPSSKENLNRGKSLPSYYGEDRLVLLPRDPYWLFAYWEVSWPTKDIIAEETQRDYASLKFGLRIHRFSEDKEAGTFFDLNITSSADHLYIKAGVPDKNYWVELGYYLPNGEFKVILTSNTVSTPRDSLSEIIDENWRLPDWQARRLYWRIGRGNLSSLEMAQRGLQLPQKKEESRATK